MTDIQAIEANTKTRFVGFSAGLGLYLPRDKEKSLDILRAAKAKYNHQLQIFTEEDQSILDYWNKNGIPIKIFHEIQNTPLSTDDMCALFCNESRLNIFHANMATGFHREPIQRYFESFRHLPVVNLGAEFGPANLDDGFAGDLNEIAPYYRMEFRNPTDPGVYYSPREECLKYIPRYKYADSDNYFYSVRHLFDFLETIVKNHHDLREKLTDRCAD